jgi:hypothetical protein
MPADPRRMQAKGDDMWSRKAAKGRRGNPRVISAQAKQRETPSAWHRTIALTPQPVCIVDVAEIFGGGTDHEVKFEGRCRPPNRQLDIVTKVPFLQIRI